MQCSQATTMIDDEELVAIIEDVQLVPMLPKAEKEDDAEIYLLIKHILENG